MILMMNPTAHTLPICKNHDTFDHSSVAMVTTIIEMSNPSCDTNKEDMAVMMQERSRLERSNKKSSILLKRHHEHVAAPSRCNTLLKRKKENELQLHLKLTFISVSRSTPKVSSKRHLQTSESCGLISTSI